MKKVHILCTLICTILLAVPGVVRAQTPTVTNTAPHNGENDVDLAEYMYAYFSESIDASTITSNRFFCHAGQRGQLQGWIAPVSGDVNWARLDPWANFLPGERVFVQLTHGISNAAASAELRPHIWEFRAAATNAAALFADSQPFGPVASSEPSLGDIDRDGHLDLVLVPWGSGTEVWTNDGSGTFWDTGQNLWTNNALALGDFNRDGYLDALSVYGTVSSMWTNDRNGVFYKTPQVLTNLRGMAVAVGDVNGDGDLDAVVGRDNASCKVWTNDGHAFLYDSGQALGTFDEPCPAVGDVDGDGDLDICIVGWDAAGEVWTNDGSGNFSVTAHALGADRATDLAVGDVNGDHALDAFVAHNATANRVWTNNGNGRFYAAQYVGTILDNNEDVALEDVNGDGWLDAMFLDHVGGMWVRTNDRTGVFCTHNGQTNGSLAGYAMAIGDVDEDGDLDAVVAKVGLGCRVGVNTRSTMWVLGTNGAQIASSEGASQQKGTDFYSLQVGQERYHRLAISNAGPVHLELFGITTNGAGKAHFRVRNVPWHGFSTGEVQNFWVDYRPTAVGVHTAEVRIANNGATRPYKVSVRGESLPPRVTNTIPANAAYDVSQDAAIVAQFGPQMKQSTITSNRFFLYSGQSGFRYGSLAFNGTVTEATLTPAEPLGPGERVFATLTRGIDNAPGTAELIHHTWSFYAACRYGSADFDSGTLSSTSDASRAVALGDLNGDGHADAFVINSGADGDTVWFNDGSGFLQDSGQSLGTNDGRAVALGDVDRDGDLDAFVVNWNQPANVWTNDGAGMFGDSGQALGGGQGISAVLGDLDGDGDLDATVIRQGQNGYVWTNDGSGLFGNSGQTLTSGRCVDLGDMNGDGFLDMAISKHSGSVPGQIWTNNGEGVFAQSGNFGPGLAWGLALGDFNGDSALDVYMTVENGGDQVWTNNGSGAFHNTGQALGTNNSQDVVLGDFDADGDLDAFVISLDQPDILWTNDGHGVFGAAATVGTNTGFRVAAADLDGNGALDVFVANEGQPNATWLNQVPRMVVRAQGGSIVGNNEPASVANGTDFGGRLWGVETATNSFQISNPSARPLFITSVTTNGAGAGHFTVSSIPTSLAGGAAKSFEVGFNPSAPGVHTAAVEIVNTSTNSPYLLYVRGTGTTVRVIDTQPPLGETIAAWGTNLTARFSTNMMASTITSNTFFLYSEKTGIRRGTISVNGDVTEATLDPDLDLKPGERVFAELTRDITNAAGTHELDHYTWSFHGDVGISGGRFLQSPQVPGTNSSWDVELGDLNGNGWLDAFIVNGSNNVGHEVWTNDGSGVFHDTGQRLGTNAGHTVSLGDVNADGFLDALVAPHGGVAALWTNSGGLFYDSGQIVGTGAVWDAELGDLNGDGWLDVFVVQGNQPDEVWTNDRHGVFYDSGERVGGQNGRAVVLGDFNGDGWLDAFVGNNSSPIRCWVNDGSGHFTLAWSYGIVTQVGALDAGDIDGDGDLEVALGLRTGGSLHICRNLGDATFTPVGMGLFNKPIYDMALGDMDGDGDLDLFVGLFVENRVF